MSERKISFATFDPSKNWAKDLPDHNWCLILIAEEPNRYYFDEIIRKSIDKNVCYICAVGSQQNLIHDLADEELAFRAADMEQRHLPPHMVMTMGEEDIEQGVWAGLYVAENPEAVIHEVVILNLAQATSVNVQMLIERFKAGYFPE